MYVDAVVRGDLIGQSSMQPKSPHRSRMPSREYDQMGNDTQESGANLLRWCMMQEPARRQIHKSTVGDAPAPHLGLPLLLPVPIRSVAVAVSGGARSLDDDDCS